MKRRERKRKREKIDAMMTADSVNNTAHSSSRKFFGFKKHLCRNKSFGAIFFLKLLHCVPFDCKSFFSAQSLTPVLLLCARFVGSIVCAFSHFSSSNCLNAVRYCWSFFLVRRRTEFYVFGANDNDFEITTKRSMGMTYRSRFPG